MGVGIIGKEEEQEIENLIEKIMKEKFPNLAKEIDVQVQEAQRIPNKLDPKRTTPRPIIIKMPKVKDKEKILKSAREKQRDPYNGVPKRISADFSKETWLARSIQSHEKQGPTSLFFVYNLRFHFFLLNVFSTTKVFTNKFIFL